MANNDYFVSFGSNVKAWADDIVVQSDRAKGAVDSVLAVINELNTVAGKDPKIRVALSQQAAADAKRTPVGTAGGPSMRVEGESLKSAIYAQVDALEHYTEQAGTLLKTMQGVVKSMESLPGRMQRTMRSIQSSLARNIEIAEGRGRSYDPNQPNRFVTPGTGTVQHGTDAAYVNAVLRQALRGSLGAEATVGTTPPAGVRTVGQQALEKAGFDRVVNAIRAQTRVIASGVGVRVEGGPANTITREGVVPTTASGTPAGPIMEPVISARDKLVGEIVAIAATGKNLSLTESRQLVERLDTELAQFTGKISDLDDEAAGLYNLFKQQRSALQAQIRKEEREGTEFRPGISRAEQQARASREAQAAREARPTITSTELQERRLKQILVDTPSEADFLERARARYTGPTGKGYKPEDLDRMAAAFRELGIAVPQFTSKMTKEARGLLLQAAHVEYQQRYPEGNPEQFRTTGFNVERVTQISDQLANMLGDLNARVAQILHAQQVVGADRLTGGRPQTPAERAQALPGAIVVPPGTVKGRREVGAAIGDYGSSLFTEQDLRDAEEVLRASAKREMSRVMGLAASPTFDPYVEVSRKDIKSGESASDRALAQAAADRLRDIRLATTELDRMGQEFHGLAESLVHNQATIDRLTKLTQHLYPEDYRGDDEIARMNRRDRDQLAAAHDEQARMAARVQELGAGGRGALFMSPEYMAGLQLREGSLTGLQAPTQDERAHGYYLGEERRGTDLDATRRALQGQAKAAQEEVVAAEKAIAASKKRIAALNEEAAAGKNINMEEYEQQVDKLERASAGLAKWTSEVDRFAQEMGHLDAVMEVTDEGVNKVSRALEGMGTRQAYEASRQASAAAGRQTLSDRRLLLSATGQAVANVGTRTGAAAIQGIIPDLGFNVKSSQFYSKSQSLGREQQDKLNIATGHLATAQRDYFQMLEDGVSTQAELDRAWVKLENAANHFANLLQAYFKLAPSFQTLTGTSPLESRDRLGYDASLGYAPFQEKTILDEQQRQAAREDAEARRTSKPTSTPEQKLVRADNAVVLAETRLADAMNRRTALTNRAAEMEAEMSLAMANSGIRSVTEQAHAMGEATRAEEEYARALLERDRLLQQRAFQQDPALSETNARGQANLRETAHLPSVPRDVLGYDASLGYNPSINDAVKAAEQRVKEAQEKRAAVVEALIPPSEEAREVQRLEQEALAAERKAVEYLEKWEAENARLAASGGTTSPALVDREKEFYRAQQAAYEARSHVQDAQERLLGAGASTPERLGQLKQQRDELIRQVSSARAEGDLSENAGYHAAREALAHVNAQIDLITHQIGDDMVTRFKQTLTEINGLDAEVERANAILAAARKAQASAAKKVEAGAATGGGAGGGGTKPPTTGGAAYGEEGDNILRQILAELKSVHTTLRGGVKTTGRASTSAGSTTAPAPRTAPATTASTTTTSDEKLERIAENQRIREAARQRNANRDARAQAREDAAATRAQQKADEQAARAVRERIRAEQDLRAIMGQVSGKTQAEIAELSRLAKAAAEAATEEERLAAQTALVAQQSKVASAIGGDLSRRGVNATDQRTAIRSTFAAAGAQVNPQEFEQVLRSARVAGGFSEVGTQWGGDLAKGTMGGFQRVFGGGSGFFDRILHTTGTFLVRNFAAGFVFGLTNELQRAVDDAIKTQQTYVRLSSTLQATGKDVGDLRSNLQGLSSQYGVALNDMYNTASKLAGVFDNSKQLENGTRTVAMLQQISEGAINADESVGALTSIWAAFGDQLQKQGGAEHIADVATSLQNLTGVNIEDTVEGVARLSGLAKQMNISFDETATFVAQISRETNTTGATAGEQLSRILEQAQSAGGQQAIKNVLGQDVFSRNTQNGAVNYGNILKELIGDWDNLSKAQQENLTHSLAGSRQAATFNALMDNGAKTLKNLVTVQNSQGEASTRMAQLMKTLNGELARFRSNFQNLVNELVQTGLLDGLGAALEGVNLLLGGLDKLLAMLNALSEANHAAGGLIHMAAAFTGAAVAARVLVGVVRGLKGAATGGGVVNLLSGGFYGGGPVEERPPAPGIGTVAGSGVIGAGEKGAAAKADATLQKAMIARAEAENERAALVARGNATEAELEKANLSVAAAEEKVTAALTAKAAVTQATQEADAAVAAAAERLALARTAQAELIMSSGASEAEVTAANEAVTAADAQLVGALRLRAASEEEAAALAKTSLRERAGEKIAGAGSGLKSFLTSPLTIAVAGTVLVQGAKTQIEGVKAAAEETGGKLPEQGATADELSAAAKAYGDALEKSKSDESKGLFGLGTGPSIEKFLTSHLGGQDLYKEAHANQNNLEAIQRSLQVAAKAMEDVDKKRLASTAGEAIATPSFTSFDSDYLNNRLQELSDEGHSAADVLGRLNDTLHATGEAAKQAQGNFYIGGKPTNDLSTWAKIAQAHAMGVLSDQGFDVSAGGPDLQTLLGARKAITSSTGQTTYQRLPRGQQGTQNTAQAINKTIDAYLAEAASQLDIGEAPALGGHALSGKELRSLQQRGFTKEVEQYKELHKALNQLFESDRTSYQTLIGEEQLTHKDATTLIGDIMSLTQQALNDLPESDLGDRTKTLRRQVQQIKATIAKTPGNGTSQMLLDLQNAQNQLAEAQFAELEAARQAAQANAHSKKEVAAIGREEVGKAIHLAVRSGDADLLAQIIQESGRAGLALAKAALNQLDRAWQTYRNAQAAVVGIMGQVNATAEQALELAHATGPANVPKPGVTPKQLHQLEQSYQANLNQAAVNFNDSTIGSGSDVPGLSDRFKKDAEKQKADASQLRADRAALVQARLGVREALAEANGNSVRAAQIEVQIAQAQMRAARDDLKHAKTKDEHVQALTAIAQARAQIIQAEAGVRDARLQDQLDTIDFNLQMNKITQSSAINALQHILRTEDLTKQQRRQLLLQIKGMKDELADSQWNFGDIHLPTPYQMRRYIEQRRKQFRDEMDSAAATSAVRGGQDHHEPFPRHSNTYSQTQSTTINIDGADIGMVRKIIKEVVGGSVNVRTTGPRRGNR